MRTSYSRANRIEEKLRPLTSTLFTLPPITRSAVSGVSTSRRAPRRRNSRDRASDTSDSTPGSKLSFVSPRIATRRTSPRPSP